MIYTLRFFFCSKCSLFHNANLFGSCIIHFLYAGCAKIKKKKNNSGAKGLSASPKCGTFEIFGHLRSDEVQYGVGLHKPRATKFCTLACNI